MRWVARAVFLLVNLAAMEQLDALGWRLGWLAYLIVAILLSFVVIVVHELGHAVVAYRLGGEVRKIVAMPFELRMRPRQLRWAKSGGADIGGYVAYTLDRIEARRKHGLIAAAGPVANLLFAGVLAILLRWNLPLPVHAMVAALIILSAGVGLANLIPFDGSDGATIWKSVFRRSRYSGR